VHISYYRYLKKTQRLQSWSQFFPKQTLIFRSCKMMEVVSNHSKFCHLMMALLKGLTHMNWVGCYHLCKCCDSFLWNKAKSTKEKWESYYELELICDGRSHTPRAWKAMWARETIESGSTITVRRAFIVKLIKDSKTIRSKQKKHIYGMVQSGRVGYGIQTLHFPLEHAASIE